MWSAECQFERRAPEHTVEMSFNDTRIAGYLKTIVVACDDRGGHGAPSLLSVGRLGCDEIDKIV